MEKNIVTVIRKILDDGTHTFVVQKNGSCSKYFNFKLGVPSDDIYNEERNKEQALLYAKELEKITPLEEIIYQTPDE